MAGNSAPPARRTSPTIAVLLSIVLPGLGQIYARRAYRGTAILGCVIVTALIAAWYGVLAWFLIPAAMWAWNIWDAARQVKGKALSASLPLLAMLVMGYGIGWQVTQIDPAALTKNLERASSIIRPMFHPDFVSHREDQNTGWVPIEVPCGLNPPPATNTINSIQATLSPDCGNLGDVLILQASGLWPDTQTQIVWQTPIGDRMPLGENNTVTLFVATDSQGGLTAAIQVPPDALSAAPDPTLPLEHRVYLIQSRSLPGYQLSKNGAYVIQGIVETLFLALIATTFGAIGAIPVSFLAARNLMGGNLITLSIYTLTRTVLNIVRSIEPLIIAIVFVVIVGLGPFAGAIAVSLHTIAALGKLYSEVIEGIDPGPIEAVRSTGGNWAQVVRYAVIPQIVPPFTSFTMYRWDINVRTSTIIGFVGGGGIGFYLYQWIFKGDFRAVGSSFIAIAIIVITLDYVSARVRARLI
jgi:phosphonate transport system permease protein